MSPRLSDLVLRAQSDERLVGLARAGHERAFAAIVERYGPELQALARRLCPDGRGEDVVQQAFLSAFAALSTGSEVRHLRGWLYQIVRNAANRPPGPLCVPLDGTIATADTLEDVVQQRAMAMTALSELARLPTRQRQAMVGTALDGRPRAEIASSMGLSEGAVRQLVHRARTTLRGAVTVLTPWPLARWIVAIRPDAPGTVELAAGAGTASSGGLAMKLGALLASGTFLTGAAVSLNGLPAHRTGAGPRAATGLHARPHGAGARSLAVASVATPVLGTGGSARPAGTAQSVSTARRVTHVGGHARHANLGRGGHDISPAGSGGRSDGGRLLDGSRNAGSAGHGGSSRGGGQDGPGDTAQRGSGSDGGRRNGGGSGSPSDGGGSRQDSGQGSGLLASTGSDGGAGSQTLSNTQSLASATDGGSGSDSTSRSGSGSISGSGSGSGSGSSSGSGTDSGSGSGTASGSGDVSNPDGGGSSGR